MKDKGKSGIFGLGILDGTVLSTLKNSANCYEYYIKALSAVNKLLLQNYYDELKSSTFMELKQYLEKVIYSGCPYALFEYADWSLSVIDAAQNPSYETFMRIRPPVYEQGAKEQNRAFRLLAEHKPIKEIREAVLEAIRITLHEPLQLSPLRGSSPEIDLVQEIGTELSQLNWDPSIYPGSHPRDYDEKIDSIVDEGIRKLRQLAKS